MKPTREEIEQQLLAYAEGTLTPAEAARVEVYLANTDPKLGVQILGMAADRAALKGLPKLRAPHDLAEQIMEQVERTSLLGTPEREAQRGARRWFQPRYAAAAAIVLLAGTFTYVIVEMVHPWDNGWHQGPGGPKSDGTTLALAPGGGVVGHDEKVADDLAKGANELKLAAKGGDLGQEQPVTVTLLAQSSEDEGRLRTMLARFVAEDEEFVQAKAQGGLEAQAPAANARVSLGEAPLDTKRTQQTDLGVKREAAPERLQQNVASQAAPGAYRYQVPVAVVAPRKAMETDKDGGESRVTFAGTAGAPYHVRLRRDQLATLTSQFAVAPMSGSADRRELLPAGAGVVTLSPAVNDNARGVEVGNGANTANTIQNYANSSGNSNGLIANGGNTGSLGIATKSGTATINSNADLSGMNTYNGTTPVTSGSLIINGPAANTAPSSLNSRDVVTNARAAKDGPASLGSVSQANSVPVIINGGSLSSPLTVPTTMPASQQIVTDSSATGSRADHGMKGVALQADGLKYLPPADRVAASDYVDCIITMVPAVAQTK